MRADTRSCTMASMARCLNQTLVQQSQEEAEWFQFCRPAVETKKEGKGKSVIEKGTESSDSTYVDRSFTGCIHLQENEVDTWLSMSMSACSSTQNHSKFGTD